MSSNLTPAASAGPSGLAGSDPRFRSLRNSTVRKRNRRGPGRVVDADEAARPRVLFRGGPRRASLPERSRDRPPADHDVDGDAPRDRADLADHIDRAAASLDLAFCAAPAAAPADDRLDGAAAPAGAAAAPADRDGDLDGAERGVAAPAIPVAAVGTVRKRTAGADRSDLVAGQPRTI